jgi:hypothetical protein
MLDVFQRRFSGNSHGAQGAGISGVFGGISSIAHDRPGGDSMKAKKRYQPQFNFPSTFNMEKELGYDAWRSEIESITDLEQAVAVRSLLIKVNQVYAALLLDSEVQIGQLLKERTPATAGVSA